MNIPYTFNLDGYDDDNQWPEIGLVPLELDLDVTESAPYRYGEDADGNRGETRQDVEYKLADITFLLDIPENLKDFIREQFAKYYDSSDYAAIVERNGGIE